MKAGYCIFLSSNKSLDLFKSFLGPYMKPSSTKELSDYGIKLLAQGHNKVTKKVLFRT